MFSSQFDSGFVSQLTTQSTDSSPSPAKTRDNNHGIRPVTVKQISEASHFEGSKSSFLIDGVDATNVTLVGMVFDKAERVTDVGFTLDDGTGRVACKRWVNEAFDKKEMEEIQDGMYVRLIGHLNNQKQIIAFSLRPVANFDEVTFHFIQCIRVHLQNSGKKPQVDVPSQSLPFNPSQSSPSQSASMGNQTSIPNQFSGQFSVEGLKGIDQMVLEYLQQPSNFEQEKGIHRDELARQLKLPAEKIMYSVRNLEEEGLIYSTIDEFHYKSTVGAC